VQNNANIKTEDDRCIHFILTNNNLLAHKDVLRSIYNNLMTFINLGKYKVIIGDG